MLRSDAANGRHRRPGEQGDGPAHDHEARRPTSPLHQRHGVYIDVVTVADVPDNYDEHFTTALDASFKKLRFRVSERHDLVLAKIARNNDKDRADVAAIAGGPGLDIDVLRARYVEELRPKLGRPEREDLTLKLWIEIIEETRHRKPG